MAYPTTLDTFPTAVDLADDTLATKPHSTLHGNLGVAVNALETKVGVTGSEVAGHRSCHAGRYYFPCDANPTSDTVCPAPKNNLWLLPFELGRTTTFDRIGTWVQVGQANTNLRMAVYDTLTGYPNVRRVDSGSVGSTSNTTVAEATISLTLEPGLYWLTVIWQGSGSTAPTISAMNMGVMKSGRFVGQATLAAGAGNLERYYAETQVGYTGAPPDPFPIANIGTGNGATVSACALRAA